MDKYRRDVTIEILTGLFVAMALIALGVFTIVLSHENLFAKKHEYVVFFSDAGGMRAGDNVVLRGVVVGRVAALELDASEREVAVRISVDVPLTFRRGYRIEVADSSLLGGRYLRIDEGSFGGPELPDGESLRGMPPVDIMQELKGSVAGLKKMTESLSGGTSGGTLGKLMNDDALYDDLTSVVGSLKKATDRIGAGEGSLGRLLIEDDGRLYADARSIFSNLNVVVSNLSEGKGTLGALAKDDRMAEDLRVTLANLRKASDDLASGKGLLGKLLADEGGDRTFADLAASLAAIRKISETVASGEGSLGKLVNDDELYDEATATLKDMRAAIDDLREASPVTSFSSIVLGAF